MLPSGTSLFACVVIHHASRVCLLRLLGVTHLRTVFSVYLQQLTNATAVTTVIVTWQWCVTSQLISNASTSSTYLPHIRKRANVPIYEMQLCKSGKDIHSYQYHVALQYSSIYCVLLQHSACITVLGSVMQFKVNTVASIASRKPQPHNVKDMASILCFHSYTINIISI
jgi:hypothetical protein